MTYYGPDFLRPYAMAVWNTEDWLNGSWSKEDQAAFDLLYDFNVMGIRPFGSNFDRILDQKDWDFYSGRYDLTYSDIKDPRKFHNSFGNATGMKQVGSYLNYVSDNVKRLYR